MSEFEQTLLVLIDDTLQQQEEKKCKSHAIAYCEFNTSIREQKTCFFK